MGRRLDVQVTQRGVFIPREALGDWDGVEIVKQKGRIVIRPKVPTLEQEQERVIQALREDGLLVEMDREPLSPPATAEERADLAGKLGLGRPLSELIIAERRAGW